MAHCTLRLAMAKSVLFSLDCYKGNDARLSEGSGVSELWGDQTSVRTLSDLLIPGVWPRTKLPNELTLMLPPQSETPPRAPPPRDATSSSSLPPHAPRNPGSIRGHSYMRLGCIHRPVLWSPA